MNRVLVDPQSLPAELGPYLANLVRRTRVACGRHLVSVVAVGSVALEDYCHGRSDIDVAIVVNPALPARAVRDLADSLAHPALPCPAVGLELVVYDSDFAARSSGDAGYLLDLNTGPLLSNRASVDPAQSPAFWYVIDRAIAHQTGCLLYGRPARQVFAAPTRHDLFAAILASVREHVDGDGHLADNRVLNGCRSVAFCRTGRWQAKRAAAHMIATTEKDFQPLIDSAVRSFQLPRPAALALPADDVKAFLTWVCACVEDVAEANVTGPNRAPD